MIRQINRTGNRPMRIGISAQLLSDRPSGTEQYIYNLIIHLLAIDKSNTYFIYCYDNDLTRSLPHNENMVIQTINLPRKKICRVFFEQILLPWLLKKDKINIYHSPAYILPLYYSNIPTVVTVFDTFAITERKFCKVHNAIYFGIMLPHALKRADAIVTLSNVVKSNIMQVCNTSENKIRVIYPGVVPKLGTVTSLKNNYILYVGNYDPKKNLMFLIKAFETLKQRTRLPHKLILAGKKEWEFHKIYQAAQMTTVAEDIEFTGYVSEEQKWELYRHASLYVFPSLFEGFGFPPIEAASVGTNILVPDIPIFKETVPGARFFSPNDIDDCVAQMSNLLTTNCRQHIDLSRFSYIKHAQECLDIYENLNRSEKQYNIPAKLKIDAKGVHNKEKVVG